MACFTRKHVSIQNIFFLNEWNMSRISVENILLCFVSTSESRVFFFFLFEYNKWQTVFILNLFILFFSLKQKYFWALSFFFQVSKTIQNNQFFFLYKNQIIWKGRNGNILNTLVKNNELQKKSRVLYIILHCLKFCKNKYIRFFGRFNGHKNLICDVLVSW